MAPAGSERADRQREHPEEQGGGERSSAQAIRVAPQRGGVRRQRNGEGDPCDQLSCGPLARIAAHQEPDPARDEEQREGEEETGARPVEAAIDQRERRYGQPDDAADGQLSEEQQKTVAEARHGESAGSGFPDRSSRRQLRRCRRGRLWRRWRGGFTLRVTEDVAQKSAQRRSAHRTTDDHAGHLTTVRIADVVQRGTAGDSADQGADDASPDPTRTPLAILHRTSRYREECGHPPCQRAQSPHVGLLRSA